MKRTVLFASVLCAATAASAQTGEITSNRGENWLSQEGDWGLTFDAQPFLNYVGNLFNGSQSNGGAAFNFNNNLNAISVKKLIDANTAYRGTVRLGFGSTKQTALVQQAGQSDPNVTVEDSEKISATNIVLGAGLEKRVGSTRVVGVYGAQALIALGSQKTTYEYGNALSATNQSNAPQFGQATGQTEQKIGGTFGLGLMVFGGIEWFCAPKLSLSGEYTWGLMLATTGEGENTFESWNAGNNSVQTTTSKTGKASSFGLDTGISGASIGINFYFQ
ncbi:MAG: hypothetical protein JNM31_05305 [Flavobacteriales bacterium]|nr:hypothetical protein [Flavobacteriales bacterium]